MTPRLPKSTPPEGRKARPKKATPSPGSSASLSGGKSSGGPFRGGKPPVNQSLGNKSKGPLPQAVTSVRLNKAIAESGLCSRREADSKIAAGQVRVNGQVIITPGIQVALGKDRIEVSGEPLRVRKPITLLFHKPAGLITTRSDERGRPTIYGVLPEKYHHCDPAGRLDKESSGALILSSDGDLLYHLTHPKFHLPKVYRVTVDKPLSEGVIRHLMKGVPLEPEGKVARFESVSWESPKVLAVVMTTGLNRQIRRMLGAVGFEVVKLKRTAVGPLTLGSLPPGKTRLLRPDELKALAQAGRPQKPSKVTTRGGSKLKAQSNPSKAAGKAKHPPKPAGSSPRPGKAPRPR